MDMKCYSSVGTNINYTEELLFNFCFKDSTYGESFVN